MAHRDNLSALSKSQHLQPNKLIPTDFASQFEEEVPAAVPIFEGHLYLRTDKKQWQRRLFRFDGTSFTCLSTRKVKLPPNTHVDPPGNNLPGLQSLPSFTTTSLTSPLLATPKSNSRQIPKTSTDLPLANYYQLPKWTVDIVNISAVSVLKPSSNKKKLGLISSATSSSKQSKCFCVRTFDGDCHIMKAQKQKDLERWLFVLTKMWKFAQAMKQQLLYQQPQHPQQRMRNTNHYLPYQSTLSSLHKPSSYYQPQDTIPLSRVYQQRNSSLEHQLRRPPYLPAVVLPTNVTAAPSQVPASAPVPTSPSPSSSTSPSPPLPKPLPTQETLSKSSIYEKRYQHPSLSVEKLECIDAWRQSLCELMASDPQLRVSSPPPIEPIPDDDQVSVISDMTSISHRQPVLRRRVSLTSSASKRSNRSNKVKPREQRSTPHHQLHDHQQHDQSLRKKRSNDVKNWIEPRKGVEKKKDTLTAVRLPLPVAPSSPLLSPIDTYQVTYFQDCKTTRSTSSGSFILNDGINANTNNKFKNNSNNDNNNSSDNNNDTNNSNIACSSEEDVKFQEVNINNNTIMLDRHAKYHSSTRAKQIQIVDGTQLSSSLKLPSADTTTVSSGRPRSHSTAAQNRQSSSFDYSPPIRRSLDNNKVSSQQHPLPPMMIESPLHTLTRVDTRKDQDEEEMSLADLQRSLKRASLQQQQVPRLTSPLLSPLMSSAERHHFQEQQQQQQQQQQKQSHKPHYQHQNAYQNHRPYKHQQPSQHFPYPSSSSVSVAAPAIPPLPYSKHSAAMMSRTSLISNTSPHMASVLNQKYDGMLNNADTTDLYHQQNQKGTNHQQKLHEKRPQSWIPSCEEQKITQQRRSVQLDTVHW